VEDLRCTAISCRCQRQNIMRRCASTTCAAQEETCQRGREEPSAGAPAAHREAHQRGREQPSAPAEQGDGSPMHWLTLVFSDPKEEMFFRRNTLVANKTLILVLGGLGLSCFVVLWATAARNGPNLTHALWTPWSIGVSTVLLLYLLTDSDTMGRMPEEGLSLNRDELYGQPSTSNLSPSWHYLVAASSYLASLGQALLYGLEPLADFEYAVWCVAGLIQLLYPFLLAYPPRNKMEVYFVNFLGYSALALGGYFGDRLRAICIGGLLLGAALALGIALERVKRLAFLHVRRDKAMVEVKVDTLATQSPGEHASCKRRPLLSCRMDPLTVVIMLVHVLPLVLLILSMELVNPYASCALLALTITLVPLIVIRYVILPLAPTKVHSPREEFPAGRKLLPF
jgi:hypothetical protein